MAIRICEEQEDEEEEDGGIFLNGNDREKVKDVISRNLKKYNCELHDISFEDIGGDGYFEYNNTTVRFSVAPIETD